MLARRFLLTVAFLYSLSLAYSTQVDYMCVKLKGETEVYKTEAYNIDDIVEITFPDQKQMGVKYIVEDAEKIVYYIIDNLIRVVFSDSPSENILYVNEDKLIESDVIYDAVIIADKVANKGVSLNIGDKTLNADMVMMHVSEKGIAPKINISGSGKLSARKFVVSRLVKGDTWTMMSLPFDVNISDIKVDGEPAVVGTNIIFREYDGEIRAKNSVEGKTASGWVNKTSGEIKANQGFAVAINSEYGDVQEVEFSSPLAAGFVVDANVIKIKLDRHESKVNNGVDADWNFIGNPTLSVQTKIGEYAVYVYNPENDSYDEYGSSQLPEYEPFSSFFVQSQEGFTDIEFTQNIARNIKSVDLDNDIVELEINGEDKLTLLLNEDSDSDYVRNEDALYMSPNNTDLSQIYMIRNGMKMAVSEQPSFDEDVTIGYIAPKGIQTISVTRLPEGMGVVLQDKVLQTEELLADGDSYEFNNTTTTNNSRFVLKFTELTGIESETADSHKILISGNTIYVKGCNGGETVTVYTVGGVVLNQQKAQGNTVEIETLAQGVLMVKIDDKVYKVVKK